MHGRKQVWWSAVSCKVNKAAFIPPHIFLHCLASRLFIPEICCSIKSERSSSDFTHTDSLFFCLKRKMATTSALKFASAHNEDKLPPDRMRSPSQPAGKYFKWRTQRSGSPVIYTWATAQDVATCTSSLLPCVYDCKSVELRGRFRSNFKMLEACR